MCSPLTLPDAGAGPAKCLPEYFSEISISGEDVDGLTLAASDQTHKDGTDQGRGRWTFHPPRQAGRQVRFSLPMAFIQLEAG